MSVISMKQLLEAGVHFGIAAAAGAQDAPVHFTERNGITSSTFSRRSRGLEKAYNFVRDTVAEGGTVFSSARASGSGKTCSRKPSGAVCLISPTLARRQPDELSHYPLTHQYMLELEKPTIRRFGCSAERGTLKTRGIEAHRRLGGYCNLNRLPDALFLCDVITDELCMRPAASAFGHRHRRYELQS